MKRREFLQLGSALPLLLRAAPTAAGQGAAASSGAATAGAVLDLAEWTNGYIEIGRAHV